MYLYIHILYICVYIFPCVLGAFFWGTKFRDAICAGGRVLDVTCKAADYPRSWARAAEEPQQQHLVP